MKKIKNKGTLSRVIQYIGGYKWLVLCTILLCFIHAVLDVTA